MPKAKSQPLQQIANALDLALRKKADLAGISGIQGHPGGHGLSVPQLMIAQRFELMGRPMTVIEGPSAAGFKGVAAIRNLIEM